MLPSSKGTNKEDSVPLSDRSLCGTEVVAPSQESISNNDQARHVLAERSFQVRRQYMTLAERQQLSLVSEGEVTDAAEPKVSIKRAEPEEQLSKAFYAQHLN